MSEWIGVVDCLGYLVCRRCNEAGRGHRLDRYVFGAPHSEEQCDYCGDTLDGQSEGCGYECGCDSIGEHDATVERSRLEFLRDPGPPPIGWSDERVARASRGIAEAQRKAGVLP